jgi:eukaryotic-like serine/threonine-protein kinase
MDSDFTQKQTLSGLERAEALSLQATLPPADVPGYKVVQLLGRGAFGQVWLGHDLNTGRQVAIKFYLHTGGVNWSLLRQEVKHLVNMSTGRYVVQVLAVGWESRPPYYVMEYLENGSLEDHLRARNVLGISEAIATLREIAEGLSFAHGKGVLHCDLKPANVLLDHSLRPRLADFGQSRMSDDQTPSLGTLFFMAPEQADLEASPDARWDVYALGAIGFTMLVGSPPYRTSDTVRQLDTANSLPQRLERYQHTLRHAPRPRLHYRRRGVDKQLCQIIDRCLAPNPGQRYANVQQVIAAIDQRQHARSRRPLVLMAFFGPILLMLLLLWFSSVSISIAKKESLEQVQQLALQGNLQTAKYAKATMEGEIKALFQLVQREALRADLAASLTTTIANNLEPLEDIATRSADVSLVDGLIGQADRIRLNELLDHRLASILAGAGQGQGDGVAVYSSLFVVTRRGTNLGIAFVDPAEKLADNPVGKNFAYRSYFHGGREDGRSTDPANSFRPVRAPQLSASFRSTSTGRWKLGISAPIWSSDIADLIENGQPPPADSEPLGVLVLTVNLGDFVLLGGGSTSDSQFTILVDGRAGNQQGTLLQHPLIEAMDRDTMLASQMPQMPAPQLERLMRLEGIVDYQDPAAAFPGGEQFAGTWIAAISQVNLPGISPLRNASKGPSEAASQTTNRTDAAVTGSDLWVLVQERNSSVFAPVRQLGNRLQWESAKALTALSLLILGLWFYFFRFGLAWQMTPYMRPVWSSSTNPPAEHPPSVLESTTRSDL